MKMPNRYRALCIQGNIPELYDLLQREAAGSKTAAQWRMKVENRFFRQRPRLRLPTNDPWIRAVLRIYQEYFVEVLTRTATPEQSEQSMIKKLSHLIGKDFVDMESLEKALELEFRDRGYHFLGGITTPFYGPYIWRETFTETYQVEIPIRTQALTVHFMNGFVMQSWLHFATFGSIGTGGWAKEDGLYCVRHRYQKVLSTERFQVSFLKHEAQHALDFVMFPRLQLKDLEYRAKLVELIYTHSNRLLIEFLQYADNDSTNDHVYAAYHIVKNLSTKIFGEAYVTDLARWKSVSVNDIQRCATQIYDEHTITLQRLGSEEVTGVI